MTSGRVLCGASATWPPTRGWPCWSTTTARTGPRCGGSSCKGTAAVLEGAAAEAGLDALADGYTPYRADRPPGPVVAVTRAGGLVVGQLIRSKCTNLPPVRVYLRVGRRC